MRKTAVLLIGLAVLVQACAGGGPEGPAAGREQRNDRALGVMLGGISGLVSAGYVYSAVRAAEGVYGPLYFGIAFGAVSVAVGYGMRAAHWRGRQGFIDVNGDTLLTDAARGGGTVLAALGLQLGCAPVALSRFGRTAQAGLPVLLAAEGDAARLDAAFVKLVRDDPVLANSCRDAEESAPSSGSSSKSALSRNGHGASRGVRPG